MLAIAVYCGNVAARRGADPETSWTAKLLSKGPEKCAEKFGEEAIEAIIEAVKGDKDRLTLEAGDVIYHLLVMLTACDVPLEDVLTKLVQMQYERNDFDFHRGTFRVRGDTLEFRIDEGAPVIVKSPPTKSRFAAYVSDHTPKALLAPGAQSSSAPVAGSSAISELR